MALDRLDFVEPGIEVELADEAPDDACLGIGIESFVEGGPAHFDLIAVRDAEPWRSSSGILAAWRVWARGDRRTGRGGCSRRGLACMHESSGSRSIWELYYNYFLKASRLLQKITASAGPGQDGWKKMVTKSRELASKPDKPGGRPAADRSKRDLALVRLMHDMGLRRGECIALDLADVSFEDSKVSVIGKGKSEPVQLTVPETTLKTLREWVAVRGDEPGPLFTRMDPGARGSND